MEKEIIYSLKSPCRDELRVTGYRFGKGEKSVCIVGKKVCAAGCVPDADYVPV